MTATPVALVNWRVVALGRAVMGNVPLFAAVAAPLMEMESPTTFAGKFEAASVRVTVGPAVSESPVPVWKPYA